MSVRDRDAFGPGDQASRTELPSIRSLTYTGPRARARAKKLQLEMQTLRVLRELPPTWTVTVQGRGRRRTVANLRRLMIESGYRLTDRSTGHTKITDAETTTETEQITSNSIKTGRVRWIRCRFERVSA
jgi:hypothetical protein